MAIFGFSRLDRIIERAFGAPDHPMASLEQTRALLKRLPVDDPLACIADVTSWLDGLSADNSFTPKLRADIVSCIDDTARPHWRAMLANFLAPDGRPQESSDGDISLLRKLAAYADAITVAYARCFESPTLIMQTADAAQILTRWMAVLGRRAAVRRMLYLAPLPGEWHEINGLYLRALDMKVERIPVQLESAPPRATSVKQEYLTLLLFEMLMPGSLKLRHMVLAYRISNRFARATLLTTTPENGARCFIDPTKDFAPHQLARSQPGAAALYIDTTNAIVQARAALPDANENTAKSIKNDFGTEFTNRERELMLRHALNWWGLTPHAPRRQRIKLQVETQVGVGLGTAIDLCSPLDQGGFTAESNITNQGLKILFEKNEKSDTVDESKDLRTFDAVSVDVSTGGIGIAMSNVDARKTKIGDLMAIRVVPETHWKVTVTKRISPWNGKTLIGLEMLSPQPLVAWLGAANPISASVWDEAHIREKSFGNRFFRGLLLDDIPDKEYVELKLVLPRERCREGAKIDFPLSGCTALLRLIEILDQTNEYAVVRVRVDEFKLPVARDAPSKTDNTDDTWGSSD